MLSVLLPLWQCVVSCVNPANQSNRTVRQEWAQRLLIRRYTFCPHHTQNTAVFLWNMFGSSPNYVPPQKGELYENTITGGAHELKREESQMHWRDVTHSTLLLSKGPRWSLKKHFLLHTFTMRGSSLKKLQIYDLKLPLRLFLSYL